MNRLIERGLLENRAKKAPPARCLPLRMQGQGWKDSPAWHFHVSRRLRTGILVGLSGGFSVLACRPCLTTVSPNTAVIIEAVVVAITVIAVHSHLSRPQPIPHRVARAIVGSASSN